MKTSYDSTVRACFVAYIVQAIVNNFAPLLFLTFQSDYGIPLSRITLLITLNFCVQLLVDGLSAKVIDRIGYRASMMLAHLLSAIGLAGLAVLPSILSPFAGLVLSVIICAVGGGVIEVLTSPIIEACPTDNKETAMSLLHSFYCWGHVGVVLGSTLFFAAFGLDNWKLLALLWAIIPVINLFAFARVPLFSLLNEGEKGLSLRQIAGNGTFWLMLLLMICAGASEQAVSQWASAFAEAGLRVSKSVGDLCGPMFFAILMGIARALYGKYGHRIQLQSFMKLSAGLCVFSYLLISLSPWPFLSLLGCGICGFSVGILWPGSFSIAAHSIARGGTLLFALLALGGDIGCAVGPTFVGMVSAVLGDQLRFGILAAGLFPICMLVGCLLLRRANKKEKRA